MSCFLSYNTIVSILKYLCLTLFLYLIIPFLCKSNSMEIIKYTFVPTLHFNAEFMSILVAILGTTISPYLFFWQATMSAEEHNQERVILSKRKFTRMKQDVGLGMLSSNIVMYFIILTTGTVLFKNGINEVVTVQDAAKALEPLAGKLSYLLFSLGIIGTGFLSIPVLGICLSYIICTSFNLNEGLDESVKNAKFFYFFIIISVLIGLAINFIGLNPIQALIFAATLYGLVSPPLLLIILMIANNKRIMGEKTNKKLSNFLGIVAFLLMTVSSIFLIYFWLVS